MAYTTVQDVRERLPFITAEVRTDAEVADFIAQAEATVDAYLRGLYYLPLQEPVDPLVSYIALDLACGLVLENVFGEDTPTDAEHPRLLKDRATRLLGAIRAGEVRLDHRGPGWTPPPTAYRPPLRDPAPGESAFRLGPHILDEEEDER